MLEIGTLLKNPDRFFVGMQYYRIMLNCIYLLYRVNKLLYGIKVYGMIAESHPTDNITNKLLQDRIVFSNRTDPLSYLNNRYIYMYQDVDLTAPTVLFRDKANFSMDLSDATVIFDPKRKWGMGAYRHNGKIKIEPRQSKRREFILIGEQDEQRIINLISK